MFRGDLKGALDRSRLDHGVIARLRGRSPRVLGLLALGAAAVAIVVIAFETLGGDGGEATPSGSGNVETTTVARRTLVETTSQPGTLGFADPQTVVNHLTGYVTWLPSEGKVIRSGGVLYRVDGRPVVLLDGKIPAYRDLESGIGDGPDVRELEVNLARLGYTDSGAMTVDDHFDSATTAAVEEWQQALGVKQTGRVELGRVVFLPGAQRIDTIQATLGGSASQASGSSASGAAPTSAAPPKGSTSLAAQPLSADGESAPQTKLADYSKGEQGTPSKGQKPPPSSQPGGGGKSGKGGGKQSDTTAASSDSSASSTGQSASQVPSNAIMTTTSTRQVVNVDLDAGEQDVARIGAKVRVELPDSRNVRGRITAVKRVATTASQSGSSGDTTTSGSSTATATIPVTVTLGRGQKVPRLDQAPVTVELTEQRRRDVLAIPVTALLATPGGGYAIEVVSDGSSRRIRVTTGLFAGGYVEISGAGVRAGLNVTNASE